MYEHRRVTLFKRDERGSAATKMRRTGVDMKRTQRTTGSMLRIATASVLLASAGFGIGCENCGVETEYEDLKDLHKATMKCCQNDPDPNACLQRWRDAKREIEN